MEHKQDKHIKEAATVIIVRDNYSKLEVLLLQRNKALNFAGGFWVFPGGKIEQLEKQNKTLIEAAKIAAARETEEEVALQINKEQLLFLNHWTTPLVEKKRFSVYFFIAPLKKEQTKNLKIDDSEIIDYKWLSPNEALTKLSQKEILMLPPTILSLMLLNNCKKIDDLISYMEHRDPLFIRPKLIKVGSKFLSFFEGDHEFETESKLTPKSVNRFNLDLQTGFYKYDYEHCKSPSVIK